MNQPLLSIVVPTKDRYPYLKKFIELVASFDCDEIEMVLQDNTADNSEILNYLNGHNYGFVRYYHKAEQIPISYNSDLAILNSRGKYVSFIGDDDGVCRGIVDCVHWMEEHDIEVVVPSIISYNWPEVFSSSKLFNEKSMLAFTSFSGKIKMVDPLEKLRDIMKLGFTFRGELPLVYHGIVKRETLNKIYSKGGTYFPGNSPDIANGVALSLVTKTYAQVDIPLIISGASRTHGGGVRQMKNRAAEIEKIPFLLPHAKENWEEKIPRVWTGETVWCESAIKALRYMNKEELIKEVNFEYLYTRFVVNSYGIRALAYSLTTNKLKLFWRSSISILIRYFNAAKRIFIQRLGCTIDGKHRVHGVSDIIEASNYFNDKYLYDYCKSE